LMGERGESPNPNRKVGCNEECVDCHDPLAKAKPPTCGCDLWNERLRTSGQGDPSISEMIPGTADDRQTRAALLQILSLPNHLAAIYVPTLPVQ
jgi:hypothetical protein